jgi:iron complex outermembrane receptor protein
MNTSGSVADSNADNYFVKAGWNLAPEQRLQASYSDFKIEGK